MAPFHSVCHIFLTRIFPVILSALLYVPLLPGQDFSGRVVGISDGDTISVMRSGRAVRVRLHGIDAPEMRIWKDVRTWYEKTTGSFELPNLEPPPEQQDMAA
jgi:endonuclease YncB( thermonuclease family)